jgi:two-component system nitrogen regulation response regulator GlnG
MTEPVIEVWIADDDASMRWVLEQAFADAGFRTRSFADVASVRAALATATPDVLLTDLRMPGEDGMALLEDARCPVIIMTAHSDLDAAVASYEGGAFDYLPKPFDLDAAVALVKRATAGRGTAEAAAPASDSDLVGVAPAMQDLFRTIGRLKRSSVEVLLTGETGTGKERVARALHRHSPRAGRPFVALNMAAIPSDLIESELFGHERGAFTGAQQRRVGRFEQADGGTLFLDEIGDMPAAAQTRLLRVLSEGEFHRVGGSQPVQVDVRVIAATHQPLAQRVAEGRFREDLYHRLNVVHLHLPPLRDRAEDIPLLLERFLTDAAEELGVERKSVPAEVVDWLKAQPRTCVAG